MNKNFSPNIKKASSSLIGCAHIKSTHNNTMITITDMEGKTLAWASSGSVGFKGSRRSTSYAAQAAAEVVGKKAKQIGVTSLHVFVKGLGEGRESAMRGLKSAGLKIHLITDVTPIPHNGCRLPKRRRL